MTDTKPEDVTDDIGGVQGSDPDEGKTATPGQAPADRSTDVPVPDAGEIEWAGAVIGKAPGGG